MQATGNNQGYGTGKLLSIQLSLDGLYFSPTEVLPLGPGTRPEYIAAAIRQHMDSGDCGALRISLDTDKTVFVPSGMYEEGSAAGYLAVNNLMDEGDGNIAVVSHPVGGVTAVMAWDRGAIDKLRETFGEDLSFVSPLQIDLLRASEWGITLRLTQDFAYIMLRREKLEYAEVLPWKTDADLIYYMKALDRTHRTRKEHILVCGHDAVNVARELSPYYRTRVHAYNKRQA